MSDTETRGLHMQRYRGWSDLLERYPMAHRMEYKWHSFIAVVPNVHLPSGWKSDICTLLFLVPTCYPSRVSPRHFFVDDPYFTLSNGAPVYQTEWRVNIHANWWGTRFHWSPLFWRPQDTLLTYVRVCLQRFQKRY